MSTSATALVADFAAALESMARVSAQVESYRSLDDPMLLELADLAARERQLADSHVALIAGEIDRRSAPALGSSGLAQRNGFRTPQEMVRVSTRSTSRDAGTAVRMGRLVHGLTPPIDELTGEVTPIAEPWLRAVGKALADGVLSAAAADAIRTGLGVPCDGVTAAALADAAARLCEEAANLDADRLFRRARELRDALDEAGIADRERERRERRSLRFVKQPDGMSRLVWLLDPESAAIAGDLFDRATSPRRGGPTFVDAELAENIAQDSRTTEQLASDVFLDLLRAGAAADDTRLLGSGGPVLRVLVMENTLESGAGHGHIEGQPDPISVESVERMLCTASIVPIVFDAHGQPLDVGREQRLFTRRQREALAVRDGGCCFTGCERPPSWCEAHHIVPWSGGGKTDVADGILLCRHHHLLLHNNHWQIIRRGAEYWLLPPPDVDPDRKPVLLPSKSAALREFVGQRAS